MSLILIGLRLYFESAVARVCFAWQSAVLFRGFVVIGVMFLSICAVIPARGGSKGIPRKNMRLMCGKPLIAYAIENALNSDLIDSVIVSSDSDEILSFASQYSGVIALDRKSELAEDAVTLDPVIYDAVLRAEDISGASFEAVVTLQPTSPLLRLETLNSALAYFLSSDCDTVISVVNAPHLSWGVKNGDVVPNYRERLNRQQLPANYLETGAFLITRRRCMKESSRLGANIEVFEVPSDEATDIDSRQDWVVCEAMLGRKKVAIRTDGHKALGLGHIFRGLTLAYALTEHDVVFLCDRQHRVGVEKLRSSFMNVVELRDDESLFSWLRENRPDVYVHDCLDTDLSFIRRVKTYAKRVVTFEDLGDGAREADAVVNALYEGASAQRNVFTGKNYVALRDEFLSVKPKDFSEKVERVLVTFGGTDPLDLTSRLYAVAKNRCVEHPSVRFDFILGPGYSNNSIVSIPELGINVFKDVVRVSDYMKNADIAFSSQGRTTFELASMGVPTIVLAQNEREQLHRFAQMDNGFINLGLGSEVSDEDLEATFEWLLKASSVRMEMRKLMLANDLKSGIDRVKRIILGETL